MDKYIRIRESKRLNKIKDEKDRYERLKNPKTHEKIVGELDNENININGEDIRINYLLEDNRYINIIPSKIIDPLDNEIEEIKKSINSMKSNIDTILDKQDKQNDEEIINLKSEFLQGTRELEDKLDYNRKETYNIQKKLNDLNNYKESSKRNILKDMPNQYNKIYSNLQEIKEDIGQISAKERQIYTLCLKADIEKQKLSYLNKYEKKFSKETFNVLKSSEEIFQAFDNGEQAQDYDWGIPYVGYFRFLEKIIRKSVGFQNKKQPIHNIINMLKKDPEWTSFVQKLENREIREFRNGAAHGEFISKNKVYTIRNFIFEKSECDGKRCWLDFLAIKDK